MGRHVEHAVFTNAFDVIIAAFELRVGEVSDEERTNFGVFAFHQLSLRDITPMHFQVACYDATEKLAHGRSNLLIVEEILAESFFHNFSSCFETVFSYHLVNFAD